MARGSATVDYVTSTERGPGGDRKYFTNRPYRERKINRKITHSLADTRTGTQRLAVQKPGTTTRRAQLRSMAVRVVHKLQHRTLGVARRTAPKAHTPGAVRRARAHPKQVVAQRRVRARRAVEGAHTQRSTPDRVVAHLRLEIIVSLRMAASAEAPLSPMTLLAILQAMGRMGKVR